MRCAKCGADGIQSFFAKVKNKIEVIAYCQVCRYVYILNKRAMRYNTK